jgi:hypothetical protein
VPTETCLPSSPTWGRRTMPDAATAHAGALGEIRFVMVAGVAAYQRDVPGAEVHVLEAGHFALDEKADEIAVLMRAFLDKHP